MFRRKVTDEIEIRGFDLQEAATVYAAVERNRAYLREWLPWVDHTRSPEAIREFIRRTRIKFETGQAPDAGIWVNGAFSGSIGCHAVDWANRHTSIGYWIDAEQQGKGIMTRCCISVLNYLFEELMLHRVEIRCGTANFRSCAIPERLGFTREGVARQAEWVNDRWLDLVVWSMLAPEWKDGAALRAGVSGRTGERL
jgi:ribosomal-protein-serine acetyltransferase